MRKDKDNDSFFFSYRVLLYTAGWTWTHVCWAGWPWMHGDLPQSPECWDCRHASVWQQKEITLVTDVGIWDPLIHLIGDYSFVVNYKSERYLWCRYIFDSQKYVSIEIVNMGNGRSLNLGYFSHDLYQDSAFGSCRSNIQKNISFSPDTGNSLPVYIRNLSLHLWFIFADLISGKYQAMWLRPSQ